MNITKNQQETIDCLTNEYQTLNDISIAFAKIQNRKGYNPSNSVWKTSLLNYLNSLIKKGLVEYEYRGKYKLKQL